MSRFLTLAVRAIISPEKILKRIADIATANDKEPCVSDDKFFVDPNGSVILNRNNAAVQKAFEENVAGLSSKRKG
ncbi:hypothetical protein EYY86_14660 [Hafnia paralvei]|uniref:hypothetical protein n=1 Tax=Hafnia TaxID=568 RepID=UPI001034128B|nr:MULTISPECIES: hypothetical protein [Hafnia]MCE9870282.1 hypothetical protein [Hafnia alvei]TBM13519.1 hypothetical protein EYY86_14660 [Hafnia paralvei]